MLILPPHPEKFLHLLHRCSTLLQYTCWHHQYSRLHVFVISPLFFRTVLMVEWSMLKQMEHLFTLLHSLIFTFVSIVTALLQDVQGLEKRYYTAVLYTVLNNKVHKSITTCRGCTHTTMYVRPRNWFMWLDMGTHSHLWKFTAWRFRCKGPLYSQFTLSSTFPLENHKFIFYVWESISVL